MANQPRAAPLPKCHRRGEHGGDRRRFYDELQRLYKLGREQEDEKV